MAQNILISCGVLGVLLLPVGCGGSSLFGTSKKSKKDSPPPPITETAANLDRCSENSRSDDDRNGGTLAPIRICSNRDVPFFGVGELKPEPRKQIWTVTENGTVTRFKIEDNRIVEKKIWTGVQSAKSGSRLYVLESGAAVIFRTGGEAFFIDASTPEGSLRNASMPNFARVDVPSKPIESEDEVCPVAYRRGGQRYLGFGYGAGHFAEVPLAPEAPHAPQWNKVSYLGRIVPPSPPTGPSPDQNRERQWGFSCYIDQKNLIYYGTQLDKDTIYAFDIANRKEVKATSATPNASFNSSDIPEVTNGPRSGPHHTIALGGDDQGNIFSGIASGDDGRITYHMVYEPKSRTVWRTTKNLESLSIFQHKCLTSERTCGSRAQFRVSNPTLRGLASLSALGNGSVVGVTRPLGNPALILLKLKDPSDITKGFDSTELSTLDGDPDMYTDFTGFSSYPTRSEIQFQLKGTNYDANKPLRGLGFTWSTFSRSLSSWQDLKLEIRCYGASSKSEYEEAKGSISKATEQSFVSSPSCAAGKKGLETIDIRISQTGSATTLIDIRKIQISIYQ